MKFESYKSEEDITNNMKLFFAGCESYYTQVKNLNINVLMSYYHMKNKFKRNPKIKEDLDLKHELFIDSGAFSSFSLGKEIDIDEYIKFCKETDADHYAVLDEIGNAAGTLKNQEYMEEQGVKPMPCFHYGEPWKYLDKYCEKYEVVALGGMVPITTSKLKRWLDVVFSKHPKQKFHGFGLTTKSLLLKYPWYSADSTSWLMGGKTGQLFSYKKGGCHYKELTMIWKMQIEEMGFTLQEIKDSYVKRNEFNILNYKKLVDLHNVKEVNFKQFQLDSFVPGVEPTEMRKSTLIEMYEEWVKENYGEIPEEIAKKLVKHYFGEKEQTHF